MLVANTSESTTSAKTAERREPTGWGGGEVDTSESKQSVPEKVTTCAALGGDNQRSCLQEARWPV